MKNIISEMFSFIKEEQTKDSYLRSLGIDGDDLHYMGSGEFGTAYTIGETGKVLKITSSKSEYDIAKSIVGEDIPSVAKIYHADIVNDDYYIIVELLDQDSEIENLFSQLMGALDDIGYSIADLPGTDLEDDLKITSDDELTKFAEEITDIYSTLIRMGVQAPDISAENLGYDNKGNLKIFDVDDIAMHR